MNFWVASCDISLIYYSVIAGTVVNMGCMSDVSGVRGKRQTQVQMQIIYYVHARKDYKYEKQEL